MGIDPISLGFTLVSGLFSAVGSVASGMAQSQQMKYQAAVAANNATIARQNAAYVEAQGVKKEKEEIYKIRNFMGQLRANRAASGLAVDAGSNVDVQSSAGMLGRLSIANVRDETARQAYGFRVQGSNFDAESTGLRAGAKNARMAGIVGGIGSALGSAASVGAQWTGLQATGSNPSTWYEPSAGGSFLGNNSLMIVR